MEFPEIGVISYDPPSDDLRSFFRKKKLVAFSGYEWNKNGVFHRADILKEVTHNAVKLPEDRREEVTKEIMDIWDFVLVGEKTRDTVTTDEIADLWVYRAFASAMERKKYMEKDKRAAELFFDEMDLNKDGIIDFSEWKKGTKAFGDEAVKSVFDAIDVNKSGVISRAEWCYAIVSFDFTSGPENPISQMFGPVTWDEN